MQISSPLVFNLLASAIARFSEPFSVSGFTNTLIRPTFTPDSFKSAIASIRRPLASKNFPPAASISGNQEISAPLLKGLGLLACSSGNETRVERATLDPSKKWRRESFTPPVNRKFSLELGQSASFSAILCHLFKQWL